MRHFSSEFETPISGISRAEERAIREVCKILGVDPDDPRNTYQSMRFSVGIISNPDNDVANPLQVTLLIAATVFLLVSRRLRRSKSAQIYNLYLGGVSAARMAPFVAALDLQDSHTISSAREPANRRVVPRKPSSFPHYLRSHHCRLSVGISSSTGAQQQPRPCDFQTRRQEYLLEDKDRAVLCNTSGGDILLQPGDRESFSTLVPHRGT